MRRMDRAPVHHIDPQAVQLQLPAAQIELQVTRKRRHMFGDAAFQLREDGGARGQVVQRGIGGIAAIAMITAPAPPRRVLRGDGETCFRQPTRNRDFSLIKLGGEYDQSITQRLGFF